MFVALAAIAWADGQLDPDEADAIVRAAVDEGLSLEEIAAIEDVDQDSRSTSGSSTAAGMSKEDRLFVYAVACWIARHRRPGDRRRRATRWRSWASGSGVPERPRVHAEAIAREVAEMPEGDRPARYDLAALAAHPGRAASPGARRADRPPSSTGELERAARARARLGYVAP